MFLLLFWYIQNFTFRITKVEITSDKVSDSITIVHLSDLHGATYGNNNRWLLEQIKMQEPDLICATGDMYTRNDEQGKKVAIELMKRATEIAPVYFVNGEHDNDSAYLEALKAGDVTVLSYGQTQCSVGDDTLAIYGIDNVYYSDTFNLFHEFDEPPEDCFSVLLAHIPNFEAFNWYGADLTLCGDTHGGVAQIPFVGPLYFNGQWVPELTSKDEYVTDKGLFDTYTGHVYVSGGLGNHPYPFRFFNRPELSVIQIVPEG
ncbi:MAG: metallophosphoesterase [Clostridia bacterium]|nr:metallophosphoesterase [Clostridia bacterium]